eukprot:1648734-Pleurochrysis_carterae.AAC.3
MSSSSQPTMALSSRPARAGQLAIQGIKALDPTITPTVAAALATRCFSRPADSRCVAVFAATAHVVATPPGN